MFEKVSQSAKSHPNPDGVVFSYGTAGFRTKGDALDGVVFRMGCLAALRSKSKQGKAIGVMVTASHNPEEDNGLKLVDPDGEMLAANWEKYATEIANAKADELASILEKIAKSENIDNSVDSLVIVGRDTRSTSSPLISSVKDGVSALGSKIIDLGEVTTPQLHFSVRMTNRGLPGDEESYYRSFSEAYRKAIIGAPSKYEKLHIDGSNGIGAPKARILAKLLEGAHEFEIFNEHGKLNYQVGADFVKTSQKIPGGVDSVSDREKKFASIDGDADRVIYYYLDKDGKFHMLDGDKIATLAAMYIREEINKLGGKANLSMGVVQTAYANGASSRYLHDTMKIELACVPTGVKYLHHKAADFDIGVYFEANGHGTVLFKEEAIHRLENLKKILGNKR